MFFGQTKYWVQFYIVFGTFAHFFCKCHYLTTINQHNRLICVFKEFFSVFWTDRGRRCTFYRFSVVLLVIRFCKSVTKGQCFQDKQKGQCHTVGLHLKGKQTSLTLGVLCLPQLHRKNRSPLNHWRVTESLSVTRSMSLECVTRDRHNNVNN